MSVMTLGKLLIYVCLCHQFDTSQMAVIFCGWNDNWRPRGK